VRRWYATWDDDTRWTDAEAFDIFRERRPHIGFAHGPRMCLGMHLARMETQVALTALLDRLPGLRIDPAEADPYIAGRVFRARPGWTSSGIDATGPLVSVMKTNEIQRTVIAERQGGDQP